MTRRTRHVLAGCLGLAVVAATAVPVLAQSHTQHQQAVVSHVKRVQANNFRFCKIKASSCSTTSDTNHRTHVLVDTRVKWIYKDTACDSNALCPGHNVTFAHRHSAGDTRTQGAVMFKTVFHHTGVYRYWCTHHRNQGMTGRIVVTRH